MNILILLFALFVPEPALTVQGHVTRVLDGDTVEVTVTTVYRVRLLDCWAPETRGKEKVKGLESKQHLEDLLDEHGRDVTLTMPREPENWKNTTLGRDLGTIWLGDQTLNEMMVRDGFAGKTKDDLEKILQ